MVLMQQLVTTLCDLEFSQGGAINQFDVPFLAQITKSDTNKNKKQTQKCPHLLHTGDNN